MKILRYKGKHNDIYFDISTEQKEQRVYLALFNYLDRCGYYGYVVDDEVLALAGGRAGNWKDAKWMLQLRREYEGWDIEYTASDDVMEKWSNL